MHTELHPWRPLQPGAIWTAIEPPIAMRRYPTYDACCACLFTPNSSELTR